LHRFEHVFKIINNFINLPSESKKAIVDMILDEIIMDEIVSENNVFRKDKDTVSK
jgi:hypothetical protein